MLELEGCGEGWEVEGLEDECGVVLLPGIVTQRNVHARASTTTTTNRSTHAQDLRGSRCPSKLFPASFVPNGVLVGALVGACV